MSIRLVDAKQRLAAKLSDYDPPVLHPIEADPWVVSSLLQKSIRRGETEIAQRAAHTLFMLKGSAIWRRLMVIAYEDIGAGAADVLMMTIAAGTDAAWRKAHGGDGRVAVALAGMLAEATKDRSTDYLICAAKDHPSLAAERLAIASGSIADRLSVLCDVSLTLPHRAMAAWYTSGIEWRGERQVGKGDLAALLEAYGELGVPEQLIVATSVAIARTREPITVMAPLAWLVAHQHPNVIICNCPLPCAAGDDVPLYALDMHTRPGREAIWRFARENEAVRACLERYVPKPGWRRAAYAAAFYVDGAPVKQRLFWEGSESLEAFGIERDFLTAGAAPEGFAPLLESVRANLQHLNAVRAEVLARSHLGSIGPTALGAVRTAAEGRG